MWNLDNYKNTVVQTACPNCCYEREWCLLMAIVHGTMIRQIVKLDRDAYRSLHLRITSKPIVGSGCYGIDIARIKLQVVF